MVLKSPVNTGIAASPTVDGTFPVYLKFYFTYMKGTNPDGTPYDDPVYYANYFNGGDAVHQFPRYSYGWYQSLGCVELPWDAAKTGLRLPELRQPGHGRPARWPERAEGGRSGSRGRPFHVRVVTCYSGWTSSACGPFGPRPRCTPPAGSPEERGIRPS